MPDTTQARWKSLFTVDQYNVETTSETALRPERPNRPFQRDVSVLTENSRNNAFDSIEFVSDQ